MVKKVFSILVAMVVLFALCACNDNSDLLKKIDELESTVQSQSDKISELEGKNKQQLDKLSELEGKNSEQADKITELEKQIAELEEQSKHYADNIGEVVEENIESVIQAFVHSGEFADLETAYENGWLTRDDIMHIGYFSPSHKVVEGTLNGNSTWQEVDFVPTKQIAELGDTAKNAIKEAYNNWLIKHGETREGYVDLCRYYGVYNNCVVVTMIYNTGFDYPAWVEYIEVGGIILSYSGPSYKVWKLK